VDLNKGECDHIFLEITLIDNSVSEIIFTYVTDRVSQFTAVPLSIDLIVTRAVSVQADLIDVDTCWSPIRPCTNLRTLGCLNNSYKLYVKVLDAHQYFRYLT